MGLFADGGEEFEAGFHGVVGLDYLCSPDFLVGVDVRSIVLPFLENEVSLDPLYLSVSFRAEWMFEL